MLRSFRFGEADRVLHLVTRDHGRVNALAKGARRTHSRLGGRLEPLSRVALLLHRGRGELATVTGADLIDGGDAIRSDPHRLAVALAGAEAVLRLFPDDTANERLYDGLVRFLERVGERPTGGAGAASRDPLLLAFVVKLLALAGWAPRVDACASCGEDVELVAFSATVGGAVCAGCGSGFDVDPRTLAALRDLLALPLGGAVSVGPAAAAAIARILDETASVHAGVRLRSLA